MKKLNFYVIQLLLINTMKKAKLKFLNKHLMKIKSNQYEEYISNPKSFYDLIHIHDSLVVNLKFDKNSLEGEVDAH